MNVFAIILYVMFLIWVIEGRRERRKSLVDASVHLSTNICGDGRRFQNSVGPLQNVIGPLLVFLGGLTSCESLLLI